MEIHNTKGITRVGVVVSDKMDKSVAVQVIRHAVHPIYGKRIIKAKKFIAHDEENSCRIGDKVMIGEVRPISKRKCWAVIKIIERAPILGGSSGSQEEA